MEGCKKIAQRLMRCTIFERKDTINEDGRGFIRWNIGNLCGLPKIWDTPDKVRGIGSIHVCICWGNFFPQPKDLGLYL
jgi:hypothetical protein